MIDPTILQSYQLLCLASILSIFVFAVVLNSLLRTRRHILLIMFFMASLMLFIPIYAVLISFDQEVQIRTIDGYGLDLVGNTNHRLMDKLRIVDLTRAPINIRFGWMFGSNTIAQYQALPRAINMPYNVLTEDIWWHELGHHIWFWHLTDSERAAFKGLHDYDVYLEEIGSFPHFPTNYSKTDFKEDWAESFERWAYSNQSYIFSYLTENLDPEREYLIENALRRITKCPEYLDARECIRTNDRYYFDEDRKGEGYYARRYTEIPLEAHEDDGKTIRWYDMIHHQVPTQYIDDIENITLTLVHIEG